MVDHPEDPEEEISDNEDNENIIVMFVYLLKALCLNFSFILLEHLICINDIDSINVIKLQKLITVYLGA